MCGRVGMKGVQVRWLGLGVFMCYDMYVGSDSYLVYRCVHLGLLIMYRMERVGDRGRPFGCDGVVFELLSYSILY